MMENNQIQETAQTHKTSKQLHRPEELELEAAAVGQKLMEPMREVFKLALQFPDQRMLWGTPLIQFGFTEAEGADLRIAFMGQGWVVKIEDPRRACGALEREYALYTRANKNDRRLFPITWFSLDPITPYLVQERCIPAERRFVPEEKVRHFKKKLLQRFPVLIERDVVRRNIGIARDGRLVIFDWEFQR